MQGDEEEPEWLVRAGKELEQMLRQWQLQQEERLDEEQRPQQMEPESTPPNVGRQGLRVVDGAASPVVFNGFGSKLRANPPLWKQSGGRQRKLKIMQNAAASDAAAQGPQDAVLQAALTESEVYAQSVQAEQDRMERQLCAEVEEARQLAATIRASLDQGIVGSRSWGTTEGDDDVEEQFKELCEAAGVAPGDIYRPTSRVPRATGAVKLEEAVFRRKCRRAGVTVACGGQREQLRRLHVARARSELFMRAKLGHDWRRKAERNLEVARARWAAQQWLAMEAQGGAGRRVGGKAGGSGGGVG